MNCSEFQERIGDFLEGRLEAGARRVFEEHRRACGDCREVLALVESEPEILWPDPEIGSFESEIRGGGIESGHVGEEPVPAEKAAPSGSLDAGSSRNANDSVDAGIGRVDAPPGFVAAVLERTTGPACGRARTLLCDHVDGLLEDPLDRELVPMHLRTCAECATLAGVLTSLAADLHGMAALEPDAAFTGDVLARTIGTREPAPLRAARVAGPGPRPSIGARLVEIGSRLMQRPRFAWEGAFVGAIVLALLFVAPGSPLARAARRGLDLATVNPVAELREPVSLAQSRVAMGARSVWDANVPRAAALSRSVAADVAARSAERIRAVENSIGTLRDRAASYFVKGRDERSPDQRDPAQGDRS
jgi:hypothetical protein